MLGNTLGLCADTAHKDQPPALAHALVRLLRDQQLAARVDAEHAVELVDRDLADVPEALDTRVRDDGVEAAEVPQRRFKERHDLSRVRDVGLHRDGVPAEGLDLADDGLGFGLRACVVDDDRSAPARELEGEDTALSAA